MSTDVLIDCLFALKVEERNLLASEARWGANASHNILLSQCRRSLVAINRELGLDPCRDARMRHGYAHPKAAS